jgi:transposase
MPSKFDTQRTTVKYFLEHRIQSTSDICKRTGLKKGTVNRYKRKWREYGSLDDLSRSGRPSKITSTFRRRLGQVKRSMPRAPAHTLAKRMSELGGSSVSAKSVQRALHRMDYHWRLPGRKKLTSSQKASRVAFAEEHLADNWKQTWAFDESYFNLHRSSNRCWVSVTTEESVQRSKLTNAQEKVSVGICFAICRSGKSALCFLPKNWSGPDLVDLFTQELLPSIRWPRGPTKAQRFIIDNDGRHQMTVWKEFVVSRRLHPLSPWPSNSPDLNPIENVFGWMKKFVENEGPTSEATLKVAVKKAFEAIPDNHLAHLMDSIPKRLELTLQRKGARINY